MEPKEDTFGYKRLCKNKICKLQITGENNQLRPSVVDPNFAKFRTKEAVVLDIYDINDPNTHYTEGYTKRRNNRFHYKVGETLSESKYDTDVDAVCSDGIHYFLSEEAAKCYSNGATSLLDSHRDDGSVSSVIFEMNTQDIDWTYRNRGDTDEELNFYTTAVALTKEYDIPFHSTELPQSFTVRRHYPSAMPQNKALRYTEDYIRTDPNTQERTLFMCMGYSTQWKLIKNQPTLLNAPGVLKYVAFFTDKQPVVSFYLDKDGLCTKTSLLDTSEEILESGRKKKIRETLSLPQMEVHRIEKTYDKKERLKLQQYFLNDELRQNRKYDTKNNIEVLTTYRKGSISSTNTLDRNTDTITEIVGDRKNVSFSEGKRKTHLCYYKDVLQSKQIYQMKNKRKIELLRENYNRDGILMTRYDLESNPDHMLITHFRPDGSKRLAKKIESDEKRAFFSYVHGEQNGLWAYYDEDEKLTHVEIHNHGRVFLVKGDSKSDKDMGDSE